MVVRSSRRSESKLASKVAQKPNNKDAWSKLSARIEQIEQTQDERYAELMKFTILRHISVMSLLLEKSHAPERLISRGKVFAQDMAARIAEAEDFEEVRRLDLALQNELRQTILAYLP